MRQPCKESAQPPMRTNDCWPYVTPRHTLEFSGLSPDDLEHAKIIARVSFWELARIGYHMNELGVSFKEARRVHYNEMKQK